MSFQAMSWAVKQQTKTPLNKLVLLCLANYTDGEGVCFPSYNKIAADCCCTRRAIINNIAQLESGGFIHLEERLRRDGGRSSNIIYLVLENNAEEGQNAPQKNGGKGSELYSPPSEPNDTGVVNYIHPPSEPNDTGVVNYIHPPSEPNDTGVVNYIHPHNNLSINLPDNQSNDTPPSLRSGGSRARDEKPKKSDSDQNKNKNQKIKTGPPPNAGKRPEPERKSEKMLVALAQSTALKKQTGKALSTAKGAATKARGHLVAVMGEEVADDLISHRKSLKKPLTLAAAKGLVKQFDAAISQFGGNYADCVQHMAARGWQGFSAGWIANEKAEYARKNGNGDPRFAHLGNGQARGIAEFLAENDARIDEKQRRERLGLKQEEANDDFAKLFG